MNNNPPEISAFCCCFWRVYLSAFYCLCFNPQAQWVVLQWVLTTSLHAALGKKNRNDCPIWDKLAHTSKHIASCSEYCKARHNHKTHVTVLAKLWLRYAGDSRPESTSTSSNNSALPEQESQGFFSGNGTSSREIPPSSVCILFLAVCWALLYSPSIS